MSKVVMGIIDDGLAFANARFRTALASSRVEYWWLQDGLAAKKPGSTLTDGYELTKAEIDAYLARATHGGMVDEDEVYQRAGLIDFLREGHNSAAWRTAHGTHVMDLAAGFEMGAAPGDRPIVAVQLPARVTVDTSGGDLGYYVVYAIQYILDRARKIGTAHGTPNLPVVINLSYGTIAGPHDGTSDLEVRIDELVALAAARGVSLRVILPAGNSYLSRCHAELAFPRAGATQNLRWRVQPDDQTPSYVEIWLPPRPAGKPRARLTLTVTAPNGRSKTLTDIHGQSRTWLGPLGEYAMLSYTDMAAPATRGRFTMATLPTLDHNPAQATAPAGMWTFAFKNRGLKPAERVHAWIQRDDSLYGHPVRGRQSYFDDPHYQRFDHAGRAVDTDNARSSVKRAGTLNAIATGSSTIVLGGYLGHEMESAPYSAAGPVLSPTTAGPASRDGPDAMAVSERSRQHQGVLAAASRSGAVVAMGGSSVAAPQVARLVASQLAAGKPGDRLFIKARAQSDEQNKPPTTRPQPTRGGAGRLRPPRGILSFREKG
jgi:hypothetical protein